MHISPLLGTPSASTAQPEARRSYSVVSNSISLIFKTFIPATEIIIHIRINQRKECILHVNFLQIQYQLLTGFLIASPLTKFLSVLLCQQTPPLTPPTSV